MNREEYLEHMKMAQYDIPRKLNHYAYANPTVTWAQAQHLYTIAAPHVLLSHP